MDNLITYGEGSHKTDAYSKFNSLEWQIKLSISLTQFDDGISPELVKALAIKIKDITRGKHVVFAHYFNKFTTARSD